MITRSLVTAPAQALPTTTCPRHDAPRLPSAPSTIADSYKPFLYYASAKITFPTSNSSDSDKPILPSTKRTLSSMVCSPGLSNLCGVQVKWFNPPPPRSLAVFHHTGFMVPIGLGLITLHIGR